MYTGGRDQQLPNLVIAHSSSADGTRRKRQRMNQTAPTAVPSCQPETDSGDALSFQLPKHVMQRGGPAHTRQRTLRAKVKAMEDRRCKPDGDQLHLAD